MSDPRLDLIMTGRVRVKRAPGAGAAYMPETRLVVQEGELYYLPLQEAIDRTDWELDQDVSHLMDDYVVPLADGCCQ